MMADFQNLLGLRLASLYKAMLTKSKDCGIILVSNSREGIDMVQKVPDVVLIQGFHPCISEKCIWIALSWNCPLNELHTKALSSHAFLAAYDKFH